MPDVLNGKKVLVMGFARQGQALARWLPTIGASVLVIDSRPPSAFEIYPDDYPYTQFRFGEEAQADLNNLRGIELVCVSGSVPLELEILQEARRRNIPLSNDADLFVARCPAPIVGITGSAGKTTTTALTGEIIKRAGYKTWVGGNIGNVLLDDLAQIQPDDVVVMELSSFQLDVMTHSPQVGAVLNITPNHLDRHKTMENYIRAKANMVLHQRGSNIAVLCEDDPNSIMLERHAKGEIVTFSMRKMVADGAFMAGDRLILAGSASYDAQPHVLCQRNEIPLRGDHNVLNVLAACAIAGSLGLATDRPGIDPDIMGEAVRAFKAVPHRLEKVREVAGVTYVNDSIATAPERTMAALRSFEEPLVLLLGGADKDLEWTACLHLALRKSRHIVLFGKPCEKPVPEKVEKNLRLLGASKDLYTRVETLEEALAKARDVAQEGDVVLLSPGGTSFDAYKDFEARGEHFRAIVKEL